MNSITREQHDRELDEVREQQADGGTSPWATRAARGALPYKVHAYASTDVRTSVVRETMADLLRRTLPPTDNGEVA